MILFGKFYNFDYDNSIDFKLDVEMTSTDSFIAFENDKLFDEQQTTFNGFYCLTLEKDGKTIYQTEGNTEGELHPVEILQLIGNHDRWWLDIDEIYSNDSIENNVLACHIEDALAEYYDDEIDLNEFMIQDYLDFETLQDYTNDILNYDCLDKGSFYDTWQSLELYFNDSYSDIDTYVYELSQQIADDIVSQEIFNNNVHTL